MTRTAAPSVIVDEFTELGQGYQLTRTVRLGDTRFRVVVKRDAYDDQGYGQVDVWLAAHGWTLIHRTPGQQLSGMPSYVSKDTGAKRAAAVQVYDRLLALAVAVAVA